MFRYNLRSATAFLTIISILGPNSVYAMEPDEPEVRGIVLRAPTPELREAETALIVHPQTEEPAPMEEEAAPNVQSQAIVVAPIAIEVPAEGYFARTYSAISSRLSTVSNGIYNAGSIVANSLTEGASEARRGVNIFMKGVDLYPIMQQTVPAMRQARQEAVEYWNQPSADQPAALKNIMVGFTREMGPNLHHLLINANRILGPEFTAKLVQSTGLTQRVGTMVGNNMMKLSNPLGWGTTLITLTQIGFNVADLKQDGLFGLAKRKIAKIAAKKVGLPEDYMRREQEVLKTEQIFLEEAEKWCQYQREHPADESEDSWVITNWFARLANNISNTHSYPRNKEWNDAVQAYHTAQTNLDKAKDEFYAKNGTFKGTVLMVAYESWVKALLNTLRKTLTSFADDLESKLTTEYIPEMTASLVKDTLRAFILGYESSLKPVIEQGKELSSNAKEITDAVNTVTRNPMAILRNLAPEVIANAANDLSNMGLLRTPIF